MKYAGKISLILAMAMIVTMLASSEGKTVQAASTTTLRVTYDQTGARTMLASINILETGIDIIAVPPGKTLKPLSLLSGGERTLTAISLLFSIMNLEKVRVYGIGILQLLRSF